MLDQLLRPEIQELVKEGQVTLLREVLLDWDPAEVAALLEAIEPEEDAVVFRVLPHELATRTFEWLSSDKQQDLIDHLAKDQALLASLLNNLSPDDRTELLEELPGPVVQQLLRLLSPEERKVATTLLAYPPESIGRLMTPDYVQVRAEWTVAQALDHIRATGKDSETLNVVYVVDRRLRLVDDLRIRQLLLAAPPARIDELMDERFVAPDHPESNQRVSLRAGTGCSTYSGCPTLAMSRFSSLGFKDLNGPGGSFTYPIVRSSCWINMIPAGGLLLIPEASSGCTCAYPLQTSFAYRPR